MAEPSRTRRIISVGLLMCIFVTDGAIFTQIGAFFPNEARYNKGVSIEMVGLITGSSDIACIATSLFCGWLLQSKMRNIAFCAGAASVAISSSLFGLLVFADNYYVFVIGCMACRLALGAGVALVWSTGASVLVPLFPDQKVALTAHYSTAAILGMISGPLIGSVLYSAAGYASPFIVIGCFQAVLVIFCYIIIPDCRDDRESRDETFSLAEECSSSKPASINPKSKIELFSNYVVLVATLSQLILGIFTGFSNVALAPYLRHNFHVPEKYMGYFWLPLSVAFIMGTFITNKLTNMGFGTFCMPLCPLLASVAGLLWANTLAIGAMKHLAWVFVTFTLLGISYSAATVPIFLVGEIIGLRLGFKDLTEIRIMIGGLRTGAISLGRFISSITFGGVLLSKAGFYASIMLCVGFMISSCVAQVITFFATGLFKRHYFQDN